MAAGTAPARSVAEASCIGATRRLFDRSTYLFNDRFHSYSVSPDGKRFLMIRRDPDSVPRQLNVILDGPDTVARAGAGPSNAREAGR